jgi:hypothetical protein
LLQQQLTKESFHMILALALATFGCVLVAAIIDLRNTPRPALVAGHRDSSHLTHAHPAAAPANPAPVR